MKSAASLILIMSLGVSTLPVAAEGRIASASGPIASAVVRAAVQLAAADHPIQTPDPNWSRVRGLEPGTEILVTTDVLLSELRYMLWADESAVIVLNLADLELPPGTASALKRTAATRPLYFINAQRGETFVLDNGVRIGPNGVFVADQRVASVGQIVQRIARTDVAEIASPVRTRGSAVAAVIGSAVGFGIGFYVFVGSAMDCRANCLAWQSAPVWMSIAGGLLAYHATPREVGGVIYRAP